MERPRTVNIRSNQKYVLQIEQKVCTCNEYVLVISKARKEIFDTFYCRDVFLQTHKQSLIRLHSSWRELFLVVKSNLVGLLYPHNDPIICLHPFTQKAPSVAVKNSPHSILFRDLENWILASEINTGYLFFGF